MEDTTDDSEVFETPESGDKTSSEASIEQTLSDGSGLEDSSADHSLGPVQKGASAERSEKVNKVQVNQLSEAEAVGEGVQKFLTPKYSVHQVQIHPETVLQKAQVLSRPQIKQNKADPVALPTGANCRYSDIAMPDDMANARQTLTCKMQ